ncbi:hypothetical protein DMP23_00020 [Amycolatopsis sp. A1MSW2902]
MQAAARAIRIALLLDAAVARSAKDPLPLGYFSPADGAVDPTEDEVQDILTKWAEANRDRAWGYIGAALKANTLQWSPEQLQLSSARDAAVLEISRHTGLDPEDLGVSTTSRTYANAEQRRLDLIDFVLRPFAAAIEDRLSMPDVLRAATPPATSTRTFSSRTRSRECRLTRPGARWASTTTSALPCWRTSRPPPSRRPRLRQRPRRRRSRAPPAEEPPVSAAAAAPFPTVRFSRRQPGHAHARIRAHPGRRRVHCGQCQADGVRYRCPVGRGRPIWRHEVEVREGLASLGRGRFPASSSTAITTATSHSATRPSSQAPMLGSLPRSASAAARTATRCSPSPRTRSTTVSRSKSTSSRAMAGSPTRPTKPWPWSTAPLCARSR